MICHIPKNPEVTENSNTLVVWLLGLQKIKHRKASAMGKQFFDTQTFRGKTLESGCDEWAYGSLTRRFSSGGELLASFIDGTEILPSTAGQCVYEGHEEKPPIFAGDILEWRGEKGKPLRGEVQWNNHACAYEIDIPQAGLFQIPTWADYKIVGDAWDTPDLLETFRMNETSLHDLGAQYAKDVEALNEMIASCRQRKRLAWKRGDNEEVQRQERLIELHTEQRRDLMHISGRLRGYYLRPGKSREQEKESEGDDAFPDDSPA